MVYRMELVTLWAILVAPCVVSAQTTTFDCNYQTYSDSAGVHRVDEEFRLTFLIDASAEKAYIIGNNGSSKVSFVPNSDGFTLIEITGTGNVMVTAITFKGESVHSRSSMILGARSDI